MEIYQKVSGNLPEIFHPFATLLRLDLDAGEPAPHRGLEYVLQRFYS